jgi:small-conductance mechanosensitive channel
MKRLIVYITALVFLVPQTGFTASVIGINQLEQDSTTQNSSIFQTLSNIQNKKQELLRTEVQLSQEQSAVFPEEIEIAELEETIQLLTASIQQEQETISKIQEENLSRDEPIEIDDTNLLEYQQQLADAQQNLETLQSSLADAQVQSKEAQDALSKELTQIQAEIKSLNEFAKSQAYGFLLSASVFFGFVFFLLLMRFAFGKMINRLSGHIPLQRRNTLRRLNKILFNSLIIISIVVALFSQVASFLPILAILGTALAFALRDIISSFIAWFLIGTDQGYRIGDLVETEGLRGRVLEIKPFLTIVKQTGLRGDTGRIVTFPNKRIFEQDIQNFSKMYRFTYIMLDFYLDKDSDIDSAKELLRETIEEVTRLDVDEALKNLPSLQTHFGIKEESIGPQIYIESDPRGILLRGKFFCRLDNRFKNRSDISEAFFKKVQKSRIINLRFVEFGDSDQ